jgi:uncharacterized protein (DUF169 family)
MAGATETGSQVYPFLNQATDTEWIGIKFLQHVSSPREPARMQAMRFCEAISRARDGVIDLSAEMVCCEGAQHAFGWMKNNDETFSRRLSEKIGVNHKRALELVRQVPALGYPYMGIRVGRGINADVLVAYVLPETAMRLIRWWETGTGRSLHTDISSIMAVCGNAVVKAYMNQAVSISFGCPDSRRYGGIAPEQMVIAVSTHLLTRLGGLRPF